MSDIWSEFGARRDDVFVCQVRHDNANAWNQSHNIMMKNYNLKVVQSCHFIRTTILFIHALYCTRIDFSMNFVIYICFDTITCGLTPAREEDPQRKWLKWVSVPYVYNLLILLHTRDLLCPEAPPPPMSLPPETFAKIYAYFVTFYNEFSFFFPLFSNIPPFVGNF